MAESTPCLPATLPSRKCLKGAMPALRPPSCVVECYIQDGPALPSPKVSLKPRRRGSCRSLGADDVPGPGLMLGPWCQVGDDHLYSLQFLILGRDRAHLIGDLVAFHRYILPFHIRDVQEDVRTTISWGDEAVALGSAEAFTDSFVDRALRSPHRR